MYINYNTLIVKSFLIFKDIYIKNLTLNDDYTL